MGTELRMFRSANESSWSLEVELGRFSRSAKVQKLPASRSSSELSAHQMAPSGVIAHWRGRRALEPMEIFSSVQRRARSTPLRDGDSDTRRPCWTLSLRFLRAFPALLWSPSLWLILGRLTLPGQPLRARLAQIEREVRVRGRCHARHGRRRNRTAPQVPLSLRHRLLLLRYDGQYIHQVSPVDSGGRQSSIARTPSPRVSLRRICFRACVCRFLNYATS